VQGQVEALRQGGGGLHATQEGRAEELRDVFAGQGPRELPWWLDRFSPRLSERLWQVALRRLRRDLESAAEADVPA